MKDVFSGSRADILQALFSGLGGALEKLSFRLAAMRQFPGNGDFSIAEVEVSGEKAGPLLEQWKRDSWTLRWVLPSDFEKMTLPDIGAGGDRKYVYPLLLARAAKVSPVPVPDPGGGGKKDNGRERFVFRHDSVPDLEGALNAVVPSWWAAAMGKWRAFAASAAGKDVIALEDLVRLESSLNGLFLSFGGREECGAREYSPEWNGLKALEECRRLEVDWGGRQKGRVRRPHLSHEGRLCPFQTPESPKIGLQLYLSADAGREGGRISPGDTIFSAAAGLIPYLLHTDGPRLLMGGKNMKQAETSIRSPEPPMVPGCLEGDRMDELRVFPYANRKRGRFFPYLGRNVWAAVMPFDGYTYEDGLVVSESLAEAFSINRYYFSEVIDFRSLQTAREYVSLGQAGLSALLKKEAEARVGSAGTFLEYGDPLPSDFLEGFFSPQDRARLGCRYWFRLPARLSGADTDVVLHRDGRADLRVRFRYEAGLPLGFGDKLTGRHGNKGVVTRVLKDGERPVALVGGRQVPIDLMISPCSILGRKNLGQILEMLHGALLWGKAEGIEGLESVPGERLFLPSEIREFAVPALGRSLGADEEGLFPVRLSDGREVKAFAGPQYFMRLHHHSKRKLQARGGSGPGDPLTGMPDRGGARTAQKLGEMEHWSLLSYGQTGKDLLFAMREKRAPAESAARMREVFSLALLALGFRVSGDKALALRRIGPGDRRSLEKEGYEVRETSVYNAVQRLQEVIGEGDGQGAATREILKIDRILVKNDDPKGSDPRSPGDVVFERTGRRFLPFDGEGALWVPLDLFSGRMDLAGTPGNESPATGFFRLCDGLKRWARGEGEMEGEEAAYTGRVIRSYTNLLLSFLGGKEGLVRGRMMGRRFAASGRSVIVPEPSLAPDEVLLPLAQALEMFGGATDIVERLWERQKGAFPGAFLPEKKGVSLAPDAGSLEGLLAEEPVWCLLIRQPSLHRHSVQAYRVRVWERDVIGIPPLVTPGFGADFDGDTMAVFLPPEPFAGDLSALSILENPGIVGTGRLALASDLDLALGWEALGEPGRRGFLKKAGARHKKGLNFREGLALIVAALEGRPADEKRELLRELQMAVCRASTGTGSLGPAAFKRLNDGFRAACTSTGWQEKARAEDGEFMKKAEKALKDNAEGAIGLLVNSGAKGGMEDLRAIGAFLGEQKVFAEDEQESAGAEERAFIASNLWEGLTEEELFVYSYACRNSMQDKKLSVAEAGYLSRLLAEGLFEASVTEGDCGAEAGLLIRYDGESGRILLELPEGQGIEFPPGDDLAADLTRLAWGRVPVGMDRCLCEDDLGRLAALWQGGKGTLKGDLGRHVSTRKGGLEIRSPLLCRTARPGLCSLCCGADLSGKPLGRATPVPAGAQVGLTAAQAIGERGTQLSMKKFHQVSGGAKEEQEKETKTVRLRKILVNGEAGGKGGAKLHERLADLLDVLAYRGKADKDLPQAFIHFEIALRPGRGLKAEAVSRAEGGFLSALSFERVGDVLRKASEKAGAGGAGGLEDNFSCLKSRLLWS